MQLHCAEIVDMLRNRPIFMTDEMGTPLVVPPAHKIRKDLILPLLPKIHQAQKFIFDSGSDQDPRTVMAVRDTSVAMIEAKLFHQPHKIIWIEDPYETDPDHERNYYLGIEGDSEITVYSFNRSSTENRLNALRQSADPMMNMDLRSLERALDKAPELVFHPFRMVIDLTDPSDDFQVPGLRQATPLLTKVFGEMMYSYKKLIVTLNTVNPEIERIGTERQSKSSTRFRTYDHQIVRVPLDPIESDESDESAEQDGKPKRPRRKHLVRGYVYGKLTRPSEQQRWVQPYWRGNAEAGRVRRDHYEIRSKPPGADLADNSHDSLPK